MNTRHGTHGLISCEMGSGVSDTSNRSIRSTSMLLSALLKKITRLTRKPFAYLRTATSRTFSVSPPDSVRISRSVGRREHRRKRRATFRRWTLPATRDGAGPNPHMGGQQRWRTVPMVAEQLGKLLKSLS